MPMRGMKAFRVSWVFAWAVSALLLGCGRSDRPGEGGGAGQASAAREAVPGTPEAPRVVTIEVGDSMKFSLVRVNAKAGETLRLDLVNNGSAPKEAMGHNWVLLTKAADLTAFANAALKAKETDYVPADRASEVIAHTKLLGGKSRDSVVFTAPAEAGEYPYLCTFPAHFQLGMKGVLVVAP